MTLVSTTERAGLVELTYRVAPGTYQVYRCDPQSGRCSCARGERTDCRHLREAAQEHARTDVA